MTLTVAAVGPSPLPALRRGARAGCAPPRPHPAPSRSRPRGSRRSGAASWRAPPDTSRWRWSTSRAWPRRRTASGWWRCAGAIRARAEERFRAALALNEDLAEAHVNLAGLLMRREADQILEAIDGFRFGNVEFHRGLADVEIHLAGRAADVAEIGVGHFAGAVHDAAHDGDLHALEMRRSRL